MNNSCQRENYFNLRNAMPTAGYAYAHILKKTDSQLPSSSNKGHESIPSLSTLSSLSRITDIASLHYCPGIRVPRPEHTESSLEEQADWKKNLHTLIEQIQTQNPESDVEVWAQDEHRVGLKPVIRRRKGR